ncbi:glycosyl transferase, family 2 [Castellaniella defragrans 65Phen]|jgi:succinoglycan biosynthesis protein ExoM|uniref:Glycosyl transferase, family 2 n=2 Tax=Castellaniella defragrans TaxID=75697 RepID=W8X0M1_CASD6|nr:glycosyltransferase family 2 protein [Castellaniella defragrans]KAB0609136.1 glycosyltransferase family 2 protein [Castellaniella defragrans]MBB6083297.1 succinoglycan biosynthesis protein ExoM [Castellaniella defragrans]CDM25444.1 glycosyl transferase, family 2 [Castellaniella defragrans 65Phen]
MTDPRAADISLCICTFRRPARIDALLHALYRQTALRRVREIIVVDNDPGRSAAPVLERHAASCPVPLVAAHCPEPNISLARNTAIRQASGDWIAIIDDDETPVAGWLQHLIELAQAQAADGVFGPVVPVYPDATPAWIIEGRYFERRRLPTGALVPRTDVRSGNVLLRRSLLLQEPGPFDPAFGLTGGSDTLLFCRLLDRRARFLWCDEAVVHEPVEPGRATLRWLLKRAYRGGQSFIRVSALTTPGWRKPLRLAWLLGRAALQLPVALVLALGCWPWNPVRAIHYLRLASAQCGKLGAAVGLHYQEYRPRT